MTSSQKKLGDLGANVKEENVLVKLTERMKKEMDTKLERLDIAQSQVAKRYHQLLKESLALSREHDIVRASLPSVQRYSRYSIPQNVQKVEERYTRCRISKSDSLTTLSSDSVESARNTPSLKLKILNDSYEVPYRRKYYTSSDLKKPSTRLELKHNMWGNVTYCREYSSREKNMPKWVQKVRAPSEVENQYTKLATFSRVEKTLLEPPYKQPAIEIFEVKQRRIIENKIHREAMDEFLNNLEVFKTDYKIQASSVRDKSQLLRNRRRAIYLD